MTPTANTASVQSANARQPSLPRRPRLGSAIASAVVSCALFGSVVLGMTSMGQGGEQIVAQGHAAAHA